ncbi:DNA recombination/repair protein RecA, partial [Acinetobacter baumannii]
YQGNKIGQGKNNVIRYFEENKHIAEEIERNIREQLLTTGTNGAVQIEDDEEEPDLLLES